MANIIFKNINKTYPNNICVISNLNLEINDKEFIVLVGPSGCGKSTTLRMIAGLEEITLGELYINEKLSNNIPPKERDIAMVFQNYALYPHMSVYKNIAFGLILNKTPKADIKQRVHEVAKALDLIPLLDRKPKTLSGGQRQRVALARAMVRKPSVFLLDEPLSNLDSNLRTSMRTEITKLHKKLDTTFVYVTHDQVEAMTMGDRIAVMNNGKIEQFDTPQKIYENPSNIFIADFIGTPKMNFIECTVLFKDDKFFATFNDISIYLKPHRFDYNILNNYISKPIILGIRPEDLHITNKFTENDNIISAKVDICEMMGCEVYIHLYSNTQKFTIKTSTANKAEINSEVKFIIDIDKIHLFDKETEYNLLTTSIH